MDLAAALSLVLVLEGLALVMLARSLPELLAALDGVGPQAMRRIGLVMLGVGAVLYVAIRG